MIDPLVSAIIPVGPGVCRAGEPSLAWLRAAIESALAQEPPFVLGRRMEPGWLELVVSIENRGGNDPQLLAAWPRDVRVVTGGSPAATRNAGVAKSSGRWLAFLDADDLWVPGKTAIQLSSVAGSEAYHSGLNPLAVVYSNCTVIDVGVAVLASNLGGVDAVGCLADLVSGNRVPLSTAMIRREWFDRVGGFSESPGLVGVEDYNLWLSVAVEGGRFFYVPASLASYRRRPGQLSSDALRMAKGDTAALRSGWLRMLQSAECRVRSAE